MDIKDNNNTILLEKRQYNGKEYAPVVDFESWRVALLNYSEDLLPKEIHNMQRHNFTDEVFVLLSGVCLLFLGGTGTSVNEVITVKLEPGIVYNVKKGVWHNHTLSKDAKVLIVENRDTVDTDENSPFTGLDTNAKNQIIEKSKYYGLYD